MSLVTANPWHAKADALARWLMLRLVNRSDRCGKYFADPETGRTRQCADPPDAANAAVGFLTHARLVRHCRATATPHVVGSYSLGPDEFGKWAAADIDNHDDKADAEANERYALHLYDLCRDLGFRSVLLYESNGKGGFHLWVLFDGAVPGGRLYQFGRWLVHGFADFGFAKEPETFPKQPGGVPWGNWLRLPGRHHTREVWPRVWTGDAWVTGDEAVDHVLSLTGDDPDLIPAQAVAHGVEVVSGGSAPADRQRDPGVVYAWEDFNKRATFQTVAELLERHGWTAGKKRRDGAVGFIRPGKNARDGEGGNLIDRDGVPVFYCFTDGAPPLAPNRGYTPASLLALLDRGGDFKESNRLLHEQGYGTRPPSSKNAKPYQSLPNPAPGGSELIITPLVGKKVRPVRYYVPGRVPVGKLVLCAGRGGDGKSTFWRSVAADLSAGRCAMGLTYPNPVRAKVLIVPAEDGTEDVILPALLAEGADISRIAILEGVRRGGAKTDFTLAPEHVELVRQRLAQSPDIKLIILDPIASFIGRARIDDHRATELRLVLDPLRDLAEASGVCIVMIAHVNKNTGGDAVDRIAGSAAYRDAVRAAYVVTRDPDDEDRRLMMPVKHNIRGFSTSTIPYSLAPLSDADAAAVLGRDEFGHLGKEDLAEMRTQLCRVRFDPPKSVDPNEAMRAKKSDGTKVQRCKEWLRQFLARYAYPSKEIVEAAEKAGFTFDNQKEAKAELKSEGVINHSSSRFPGGFWSGPGHPSAWVARPAPASPPLPSSPPLPTTPPLSLGGGELGSGEREWGEGVGSPGPFAPESGVL